MKQIANAYLLEIELIIFLALFAMCDGFNHGALQIAVAQICQSMGWDALQKSSHDLLTDVLQKYLEEIAKSAHGYSQICEFGRSVQLYFITKCIQFIAC